MLTFKDFTSWMNLYSKFSEIFFNVILSMTSQHWLDDGLESGRQQTII